MKTAQFIYALLLLAMPLGTWAQHGGNGDVNGDGQISIADVNALNDMLFGILDITAGADVNNDSEVNVADINAIIAMILNEPVADYVDLGLPSGTLWATRNVGASSPEDYGDLFAWGETQPKEKYSWKTYKWGDYDAQGHFFLTKYNTYSNDSAFDSKTELEPIDDAASVHYPHGRMPSIAQVQELMNYCSRQWVQRGGVNGTLVTGPNGNTMFLPAAGYRRDSTHYRAGAHGYYWARTLNASYPEVAFNLYFLKTDWLWQLNYFRYLGHSVRAVRDQ